MGASPTILPPSEVESIVLAAAEQRARELGLTISSPAKARLQTKSLPVLIALNEAGELADRRAEIEYNTATLIQFTFEQPLGGRRGEITLDLISSVLSSFCQRFPDFIPFCP
jgi:hypothetical protein